MVVMLILLIAGVSALVLLEKNKAYIGGIVLLVFILLLVYVLVDWCFYAPLAGPGGQPGFYYGPGYGMWGPKGLPKPNITRWNQEVAKSLQTEEMKKRLAADGVEPAGSPPEQFLNVLARHLHNRTKVVKAGNNKAVLFKPP